MLQEHLVDLQDMVALAAHMADKAEGRAGVAFEDLDEALDKIDAEERFLEE